MQIIFYHIPKTAGASFRSILKTQYGKTKSFYINDMYPGESLSYLGDLSDAEYFNIELIAGHGAHYVTERGNEVKRIIFLREPLRQIISRFKHVKRSLHNLNYNRFKSLKTLEDYFFFLEDTDGFNMQVDYLSRDKDAFLNNLPNNKSPEEKIYVAKRIIDKCQYTLITEDFDSAIMLLKKDLNWSYPLYISKNKSKESPIERNSHALLPKFKEKQYLDYKLYEYAKKSYMELKYGNLSYLERNIIKFKMYNRVYRIYKSPQVVIKSKLFNFFKIERNEWLKPPAYDRKTYRQ